MYYCIEDIKYNQDNSSRANSIPIPIRNRELFLIMLREEWDRCQSHTDSRVYYKDQN